MCYIYIHEWLYPARFFTGMKATVFNDPATQGPELEKKTAERKPRVEERNEKIFFLKK